MRVEKMAELMAAEMVLMKVDMRVALTVYQMVVMMAV